MNRKSKLFFSIMSLCFSIAVLCFGVYSAVSVNYSVSGSLSYTVEDVFVDIETTLYMSTEDYDVAKSNISTNITTLETNLPNTTPSNMYKTTYRDPHSTYNNGNVNTEDTITFNNEDNELPINYGAYSQGNTAYAYYIVIAITNHGQDIINAQVDLGDTSTLNSVLQTNNTQVNIQGKTETVTTTEYIIIAMALDNAVQSVNQSFNFDITIGMGEFVPEIIPDMTFAFDEQNKTASLYLYTGEGGNVVIPNRLSMTSTPAPTLKFENLNEFNFSLNNDMNVNLLYLPSTIIYGEDKLSEESNVPFLWIQNKIMADSNPDQCFPMTVIPKQEWVVDNDFYQELDNLIGDTVDEFILLQLEMAQIGLYTVEYKIGDSGEFTKVNVANAEEHYSVVESAVGAIAADAYAPAITFRNVIILQPCVGSEYTVTNIANQAFWNRSSLETITIPASVESVGNEAFSGCSGLTTVYIDSATIAGQLTGRSYYIVGGLLGEVDIGESVYIRTGLTVPEDYLNSTNFDITENVIVPGRDGTYTQYTRK